MALPGCTCCQGNTLLLVHESRCSLYERPACSSCDCEVRENVWSAPLSGGPHRVYWPDSVVNEMEPAERAYYARCRNPFHYGAEGLKAAEAERTAPHPTPGGGVSS